MSPTNETRKEKYLVSSEEIQNLYSSSESGEVLMKIFQKNALDEKDYTSYVLTVGDVILGFYPKSELPSLLQKNIALPEGIATQIALDLTDFLTPISKNSTPAAQTVADQSVAESHADAAGEMTITSAKPPMPDSQQTQAPADPIAVPRYAKPLTDLPKYDDNQ